MTTPRSVRHDEPPRLARGGSPIALDVMKDYYERYWLPDEPVPVRDPLAGERLRILFGCMESADVRSALEVGCGRGEVVAHLRERGVDALGMDISETAVRLASRRHPDCRFASHPVEARPWPGGAAAYDLVVSFEVIEHLLEPRCLLEGAHEVLRSGGYLALTTPFHGLIKNVALVVRGFDHHFDADGPHIRFFSDGMLGRMLDETGFEVVRVKHFGRVPPLSAGVFLWARKR